MRAPIALVTVLSLAIVAAVPGLASSSTKVREEVSLSFEGRTITTLEIENFHSRTHSDPYMGHSCRLPDEIGGVIWKVWMGGAKINEEEITVQNEDGEAFRRVCWSSSSGNTKIMDADGNVTFEGPTTELLFAGPDDSGSLELKFGEAVATIEMPVKQGCPVICSASGPGQWKIVFECEAPGQRVATIAYKGFTQQFQDGKPVIAKGDVGYEFQGSGNSYRATVDVKPCEESDTGHCITADVSGVNLGPDPVHCQNF
jgi:hypothetical protein